MKKRGQVTIFIILGVLIIGSIIVLFAIGNKEFEVEYTPETLGPRGFIQQCVSDIIRDSEREILENGMVTEPKISIMYNGTQVTYHCYTANNYESCYNLYPMLQQKLEQKLESDLQARIQDDCFNILLSDFENKGYEVRGNKTTLSLEAVPGEIRIRVRKSIAITRGDSGENFENFDTKVISPIYEFAKIASQITNSETSACYFEYNGYTILYPDYRIRLISREESKIYRVLDTKTNKEFSMATRGCAIPSGIF